MIKSKYLYVLLIICILFTIPMVKADMGELRYEITNFSINDSDKTITFKGWAFIHQTNNYNTIYKLVNNNDNSTSDVVVTNGGQNIKISVYDNSGNYIDSKSVSGSSKFNYNFTRRMYYQYVDYTFEKDYNRESGSRGNMNCDNNSLNSNCYYKDLYFEISFNINDNWYGKDVYFTIAATNNDYKNKTGRSWTNEEKLYILSNKYGGPKLNLNSQIVKVYENTTSNKIRFMAETALVKNYSWTELGPYGHQGDIFLVSGYDENGYSGIGGTKGIGRYFLYSSGVRACNLPGVKWYNKSCYYGSDTATNTVIGAWNIWVIPYGTTSFTIKINEDDKKCSIDNSNNSPLLCNDSQKLVSECDELTVYDGNETAVVSIKQTGVISNILTPKEIYNGGGIKFGIIYYNKIDFDYVSGSKDVNITNVMNDRVISYDNIVIENFKIGNILVDSSFLNKQCSQTKNNNSVETICLFYFNPQVVNEDGSIKKDDIDAMFDYGINNKYYLPLEYVPVYRVSASILNASLLNRDYAKSDGEGNKVWYGSKWDEIVLSSDGSCDINVYKLGPGSYSNSDFNNDGDNTKSKVIYKYIYRPIDLDNPFPGPNRAVGLNWYLWYNNNRDRLKEAYDHLDYSIELNSNSIYNIKKYNSSNNYFNFDFDSFINETGLKVGGNE